MHNSNSMTAKGFIESLTHPRKVELAEILLAKDFNVEEIDVEGLAEKGYGRMTVIEMGRQISREVEGMEEFTFDWPRNSEAEATGKEKAVENQAAKEEAAKVAADEKAEADAKAAEEKAAADKVAEEKAAEDKAAADAEAAKTDQSVTGERTAFKVIAGVEFPKGTAHEVGTILKLTADEAAGFAEGLIEAVVEETVPSEEVADDTKTDNA